MIELQTSNIQLSSCFDQRLSFWKLVPESIAAISPHLAGFQFFTFFLHHYPNIYNVILRENAKNRNKHLMFFGPCSVQFHPLGTRVDVLLEVPVLGNSMHGHQLLHCQMPLGQEKILPWHCLRFRKSIQPKQVMESEKGHAKHYEVTCW